MDSEPYFRHARGLLWPESLTRKEMIQEPAEQEQYEDHRPQDHNFRQVDKGKIPAVNFIPPFTKQSGLYGLVSKDGKWTLD
jgi:hypothetical protein